MTLRLANDLGMTKVSEMGERMGIYDKLPPYEAMALGAGETTPMRLATAYASLVNGGKQVHPVFFDRIQNRYGETVYRTDQRPCEGCSAAWQQGLQPPALPDERKQLIDPVTAYQMVSILEGVVQRGTAGTAKSVGKPLAAKTGTTNDFFDAWTMGFSPDLVVGVWFGFDTPHTMGDHESSGRVAAPVFRDFMMVALKDKPATPFRQPGGVDLVSVDLFSGCLPSPDTREEILEAFKPGTGPTGRCEAGGSSSYRIDFANAAAGDEARASKTPPAEQPVVPPGQDVAATNPVDPTTPQPPQPQKPPEELTIKPGQTF